LSNEFKVGLRGRRRLAGGRQAADDDVVARPAQVSRCALYGPDADRDATRCEPPIDFTGVLSCGAKELANFSSSGLAEPATCRADLNARRQRRAQVPTDRFARHPKDANDRPDRPSAPGSVSHGIDSTAIEHGPLRGCGAARSRLGSASKLFGMFFLVVGGGSLLVTHAPGRSLNLLMSPGELDATETATIPGRHFVLKRYRHYASSGSELRPVDLNNPWCTYSIVRPH
jgi:hypothetical protein